MGSSRGLSVPAGEFERHERHAALPDEMALPVPFLIRVPEEIADEIAPLRVARRGAVGPPNIAAEQDVLHEVEHRRLAGAECAREQDAFTHIENLPEAIPIQRDDTREGNTPTHGEISPSCDVGCL